MSEKTMLKQALAAMAITLAYSTASFSADIPYRGVNLSSAESGGCSKPSKYGFTYIYPSSKEIDHFMAAGMNTFRIPFCWERLQKSAMAELDAAELERLDKLTAYTTAKGGYIVLDPHNYGRYWGKSITTREGTAAFTDFWKRLATRYRDNDRVLFGLMNEPHGVKSEEWLETANAAIAAIRATGAKNLILVPGVAWTGAHSWTSRSYGTPNSVSMLNVVDPANNYAYEVHQYFDTDSSGTTANCVASDIGTRRIQALQNWLRENNKKAFMGEFGNAKSDICYATTKNMLTEIHSNPDLWLGWTYWSAGPWLGNYMFALPLQNGASSPSQLDVLKKFLSCSGSHCPPPSAPKMNPPQT